MALTITYYVDCKTGSTAGIIGQGIYVCPIHLDYETTKAAARMVKTHRYTHLAIVAVGLNRNCSGHTYPTRRSVWDTVIGMYPC